jgi:hypothetical protein
MNKPVGPRLGHTDTPTVPVPAWQRHLWTPRLSDSIGYQLRNHGFQILATRPLKPDPSYQLLQTSSWIPDPARHTPGAGLSLLYYQTRLNLPTSIECWKHMNLPTRG